jgi:hypothetical protein
VQLLNRKARIALKAALTGVRTYGAIQRTRGRMAARKTAGGVRRGIALGAAAGGAAGYLLARGTGHGSTPKQ